MAKAFLDCMDEKWGLIMKCLSMCILSAALVACASTPPVELEYYHAASDITVKVIRTVACDALDNVKVANNVVVTTKHRADKGGSQFNIAELDSAWANSDVKFEFYPDGRLKGVNATTTGQGEKILSSALSFLSAEGLGQAGATAECTFIREVGNKKPITLTYVKEFKEPSLNLRAEIPPDVSSEHYHDKVKTVLGTSCAIFGDKQTSPLRAKGNARPGKDVELKLKQPAVIELEVKLDPGSSCTSPPTSLWKDGIVLAHHGEPFSLPIPKPVIFGKQAFAMALDDSGMLTLVQYAKEVGAAQPLGVGKTFADEFGGKSVAEKAAEVKAEADLIAQQQRLVSCRADPPNCQ